MIKNLYTLHGDASSFNLKGYMHENELPIAPGEHHAACMARVGVMHELQSNAACVKMQAFSYPCSLSLPSFDCCINLCII